VDDGFGLSEEKRSRPKPFHFSIHNQAFVARVLGLQHANAKPRAGVLPWDLDKALKSAARRYQKFCGNTSRYSPHQGERERARRKITGESGCLPPRSL
jgi:hypothetical protein